VRALFPWVLIVMGTAGVAGVAACSLGVSGTGQNVPSDAAADSPSDVAAEAPGPEASGTEAPSEDATDAGSVEAGCPGLTCNGACISETDCRSCAGATLLCGATRQCVAACQGCSGSDGTPLSVECFACDVNHLNPIGTCQPNNPNAYCLSGDYSGQYGGGSGYRCSCGDVTGCPGSTQVCIPLGHYDAGFCLTCGESTVGSMQGQPCKGGGSCETTQAVCQ
jgi:hypothetical protein